MVSSPLDDESVILLSIDTVRRLLADENEMAIGLALVADASSAIPTIFEDVEHIDLFKRGLPAPQLWPCLVAHLPNSDRLLQVDVLLATVGAQLDCPEATLARHRAVVVFVSEVDGSIERVGFAGPLNDLQPTHVAMTQGTFLAPN